MKSVVLFSEDFPPYAGGVGQWAAGMAASLHGLGHEVRVITRYRSEHASRPEKSRAYAVEYIQGSRWRQLRTWYCYRSLRALLNSGVTPDALIATTWNFARGVVPLIKKYGIKLIIVTHGLEVTRRMSWFKKWWLERTLNAAAHIIAVSNFTRERLLAHNSLPFEKVLVFANGVDSARFRGDVNIADLKRKLRLKDEKIILTLARVVKRKGHEYVLQALPKVIERVPQVKYVIAGPWDDRYYCSLRRIVADLHIDENVLFAGYVPEEEVAAYYNLCDVYVMPSRELPSEGDTEGFGITFLEANACEKPVIGGKSGGVVDAIEDGVTGFTVDPCKAEDIADKIILLLTDPERARSMGKAGRERVLQRYTWDVIAGEIAAACL